MNVNDFHRRFHRFSEWELLQLVKMNLKRFFYNLHLEMNNFHLSIDEHINIHSCSLEKLLVVVNHNCHFLK